MPARLAPVLKALGVAAVLYWHGQREPGADATFVLLRELFETSDIVSLHLPLTAATEGLVDALASAHLGAAWLDIRGCSRCRGATHCWASATSS